MNTNPKRTSAMYVVPILLVILALAIWLLPVSVGTEGDVSNVLEPEKVHGSSCTSTFTKARAEELALEYAEDIGFDPPSGYVDPPITSSKLKQISDIELATETDFDAPDTECYWWIVMDGELPRNERKGRPGGRPDPTLVPGTPTVTPVDFTELSVGLEHDDEAVTLWILETDTLSGPTLTPLPTATSGSTPTPWSSPTVVPDPTATP